MTAEEMVLRLVEDGYTVVDEYNGFRTGRRVRNRGEQYPEAFEHGTAVIFAVLRRQGSNWELTYRRADVEIVVVRDGGGASHWSDYGTYLALAEVGS